MDNRFSEQQSQGLLPVARETLSKSEFIKLITSKACDPANPIGYRTGLIVSVAVCLGVRLGALAALAMNQFTHSTSNDSKVIVFTSKIGSRRGGSKNQVGGRKMVGKPQTQILIWDFPILGGTLNVYNVLSDYINLRERLNLGLTAFSFEQTRKLSS